MKSKKMEVVRGSFNVFRDLGRENADVAQFKAILAPKLLRRLTGNTSRYARPTPEPALRRRTSRVSGTGTWGVSPSIALYQLLIDSDRASKRRYEFSHPKQQS